jgi:hypothetical protein
MSYSSTLLYLASGPYYPDYEDLPFDLLIFVDKNPELSAKYPKDNPRVRFIGKDALEAIDDLYQEGIKIDCLVSLNEGLDDGGGIYPMLSGFLIGYLAPLLNPNFTLICDFSHYQEPYRTPMGKMDWPVVKQKVLKPSMKGDLNPQQFSYSQRTEPYPNFGKVYRMHKIMVSTSLNFENFDTNISIIHGSIWEHEPFLDLIGINLISDYKLIGDAGKNAQNPKEFFKAKPKVYDLNGRTFREIMDFCKLHKFEHIGLCPWKDGDYAEVIEYLSTQKFKFPRSITFYHLSKNDFKQLYKLAYQDKIPNRWIGKPLPMPLCISFGRRKEWNNWLLLSSLEFQNHWENFALSAKAVEIQYEREASPLDDVKFLEKIVEDLVKNRGYELVTFPAVCTYTHSYDGIENLIEVKESFEVISRQPQIHPDYLLYYSRNVYWDMCTIDIFRNSESLKQLLLTEIKNSIAKNPELAPMEIHPLVIERVVEMGAEHLEIDHLTFIDPTRSEEGLSSFWEEWLSPDFLSRNQEKNSYPPFPKSNTPF